LGDRLNTSLTGAIMMRHVTSYEEKGQYTDDEATE